jgi:hypothetical protein
MTIPIRSQAELLDAIRARRDELNISHETIDQIAGFQGGYTSKLLAPQPIKNLGPMSLGAILGALGLALVAVADPEAEQRVSKRWQKRKRPQKLPASASRLSIENETPQILQVTPELQAKMERKEYMRMIGKRGGQVSAKRRMKIMGKRRRQAIATHAARMRWAKSRAQAYPA